jgi:hypothetical protein
MREQDPLPGKIAVTLAILIVLVVAVVGSVVINL